MNCRELFTSISLAVSLTLTGCASEYGPLSPDDEFGMDGPVDPLPPPGKEDSMNRRGLYVNTNTRATQVWTARNNWEDTDTAAARLPGLAWGADSGLTWDAKYAAWIQSMERRDGTSYYETFELTTPWGKTLPAPALECAESSIFLRITFAAWYELPFFMEAVDQHGKRVYFGHNGVRTVDGRYANTPNYGTKYKDYTGMSAADYTANWPTDSSLRQRKLWGGTDEQDMLGPDATFGQYVDEVHLNKRAGHFTLLALGYLGSINLADSANTYNIVPETVRPGDTLLERWQRRGIGHTLVVKDVTPIGESNLDVTLVSGSMPRRQPKWESGVASKRYFVDPRTGGEGTNVDGDEYAKLGGGIKRWRVTKNIGGYWTNTFMRADEASWINSTDYPRIAARPARFDSLLGEVSPEQMRDATLEIIADKRHHLRSYPASCSAREGRERAFEDLYDLMEREFSMSRAQVDAQYRLDEDYVFAELEYSQSKTCCWNSTNAAMHTIVMDHFADQQARAAEEGVCEAPAPFMSHSDGYARYKAFAEATGRGSAWREWTEDETCNQRNTATDVEREHAATPFCERAAGPGDGGGTTACTDAYEDNDSRSTAAAIGAGSYTDLAVCEGDVDWFAIAAGGTVSIAFDHSAGDLDLRAYDAAGAQTAISQSTSNAEQVTVPVGGSVEVYGYNGATGAYSLTVL